MPESPPPVISPADNIEPPPGTESRLDIAYGDGHERQKLDIHIPKGARRPAPVVVWVHGGGWRERDKRAVRIPWVLEDGYALATVGYRLTQHAPMPAQIADVNNALSWLRRHGAAHGLDTGRMVIGGASAGGHLVTLAALAREVKEFESDPAVTIAGVIDLYGPTDMLAMCLAMPGGPDHDTPDSPEADLIRAPLRQRPDLAIWMSPRTYVNKDAPPVLFMHGAADPIVPFSQSVLLEGHLRVLGVKTELVKIEGAGHGGPQFQTAEARAKVIEFIDGIYGTRR